MTRASLKATALAAAVVASTVGAIAPAAAELPTPAAGGPAELIRYVGDPSSATGSAISNGACDVNGDGHDDAVVGAWFWDKAPLTNIGAAYVLLGGPGASGGLLADPTEAGAVRIDGPAVQGATVGFAVGCLGDVNGDDLDDIAITYYGAVTTYVVFGAEDFTGLTLDSMGDRGFSVVGPAGGNFGYSVARVGDLNDDGLDDFAVAEVAADTRGRTNNGRVWVLAGRDDISDLNLTSPAEGDVLLTVDGAGEGERLGVMASVGDVNGDGIDDFLMGSYTATPWGASVAVPGAAYVIFGGATATGEIDAADLGTKGFTIVGPTRQRDRLGVSVSAAGDVNGDGLADLLVGADGVTNAATGTRSGGAAVVFGSASTDRVYTDPTAAGGQTVFTCAAPAPAAVGDPCTSPARRGYWIDGAVGGDSTGYSVAGIGDVNADGTPDLALGAYGYDPVNPAGGTFSGGGAVYVQFGQPDAVVQSLATQTETEGYRIDGTLNGDRFGRQVGTIGDFDHNGTTDLVIGADFAARAGGAQNGELTVALMGQLTTETTVAGPTSALPGDELTFTATVTKPAGDRTPLADGTVSFLLDGAAVDGCADQPLTAGEADCVVTFDAAATGDLTAVYSGTDRLQTSTSAALVLVIAPSATSTSVDGPASATIGDDVTFAAEVTTTDTEQAPVASGTVGFTHAGTAIVGCEAVTVTDGEAECTTTVTTAASGDVVAAYSGTATLAGSTSAAHPFTVSAIATPADEAWTKAAYEDFLDRAPAADELAATVARLGSGTSRVTVARELSTSDEWIQVSIRKFFRDTLDREPDAGGLAYWTGQVKTGKRTLAQVAAQFYSSSEYVRNAGGTNTDWVSDLYEKVLGRSADTAGLRYWVAQTTAKGRSHVAGSIYDSLESRRDRVAFLYDSLLGRAPDAAGRDFWAGRIATQGDLALAVHLVTSSEYANRAQVRFP